MKTLKMMALIFLGMFLCLLVLVFILLPSTILIVLTSRAIDKGIITDTPAIETTIGIIAFALPFPMTIFVQKIWKHLDPLFNKFDDF